MIVPMSLGVLCWIISVLAAIQLAYWAFQPLRSDRPSINAMSFVFLTMFVGTLLALLMGLAGVLAPLPMAGVGALILILGWQLWPRYNLSVLGSDLIRFWKQFGAAWASLPTWLQRMTVAGVILSALRFGFLIWSLPPFVWDSLTYHLTNVAHWTQTGRIATFDTSMLRIYSPANFEVLATWLTVFTHHDAFVEAVGLPSYILGALAIYAIGRGLHFSRASSWIAAMGYASTPALLLATTGTKNDPQVAAMYLGLLAIGVNLSRKRGHEHERNALGQAVLFVLVALYAVGTKAYIAHLLPGVALVIAFGERRTERWTHWSEVLRGLGNQIVLAGSGLRLGLVALLCAGIILGSYWNLRNWALTGNPFFPYGVTIVGQQVFESADRTAYLSLDRMVLNLESLGAKVGDRLGPIVPDLPEATGWGWFAYGLGFPALVWSLLRRSEVRLLTSGFTLSLLMLFLSDRPSPWNMRYVIWFPAIFSLAFAAYLDGIFKASSGYRRVLIGLLWFTLGMNLVMTVNYGRVRLEDFQAMLSRSIWDRDAADLRLTVPEEYANALEFVPRQAILGYNVTGNGFIYPLYRADLSQRLVYIPLTQDQTCDEVAEALGKRGTRYLSVAPEHTDDGLRALLGHCAGSGSVIRERARGLYVVKEPE